MGRPEIRPKKANPLSGPIPGMNVRYVSRMWVIMYCSLVDMRGYVRSVRNSWRSVHNVGRRSLEGQGFIGVNNGLMGGTGCV